MSDSEIYKSALSSAMDLCSRREYCRSDIREKAAGWGLKQDETERLIETLVMEKFIDEERYATAFVKDKFNINKWGRIKIAHMLRFKGIPSDVINRALGMLDETAYRKTLEYLITAHRRTINPRNQFDLKAKLMRFALSKGFESSMIYEILGDF
ncbi:MAG TPA: regulatory protein RecX [Bacteroidales bacterium]|jgi:regulatory protein|nr:regulatory protein RecX [Bacteroidales bacterium]